RQPPQLNCPPDTVPWPDDGSRLESRYFKGGISRLAPRELAPPLQSLPPILHMKDQDPISGYSKAARGLSVQSRVSGIFTAATVSPSSCRRQQSSRYTIRAGRNLPDKEFRSRTPRVATGLGPYLHLMRGGRRLASEDSANRSWRPFLLIVRTACIFTTAV